MKIKKKGKLEEFGLEDLDKELKEVYSYMDFKEVAKELEKNLEDLDTKIEDIDLEVEDTNLEEPEGVVMDDSIFYESLKKLKEKANYLTTKEAGEILGVSERTIQRRIKAGEIKAVNRKELGLKGRGWLIPRKEIERLKNLEK